METYDQAYKPKPKKKSPYADSIYESAYVEPQEQECAPEVTLKVRKRHGIKPVLVIALIVLCCAGTALGVGSFWQNRMDRMEAAMEDKFEALKQIYAESHSAAVDQPSVQQGPLTPGQVYARNVDAVVAVNCMIESPMGYGESTGSGFLISADGYAVTNYHVIESATSIVLMTHKGESFEAKVVGYDATNDLALLKVEGENLPFVTLGSSDALVVGDQVAAIGNPLGELTSTMTVGYISAKDRVVNTDGTVINMLQTDAAINSGNSGGPLFNMNGEVVGIITAKYSGSSGNGVSIEGLGFAIPMDDVAGMLADLQQFGYVTGAYLGVYVLDVDPVAQAYGLPAGAYVQEPMAGLAADRAGIKAGDIIVNLGGYDITCITDLTRVLRRFDANDTTSVTVYRKGELVYLTITLDEKPVEQSVPQTNPEEVPMPSEGNFDEWFDYFAPFFGFGND